MRLYKACFLKTKQTHEVIFRRYSISLNSSIKIRLCFKIILTLQMTDCESYHRGIPSVNILIMRSCFFWHCRWRIGIRIYRWLKHFYHPLHIVILDMYTKLLKKQLPLILLSSDIQRSSIVHATTIKNYSFFIFIVIHKCLQYIVTQLKLLAPRIKYIRLFQSQNRLKKQLAIAVLNSHATNSFHWVV
jgi:hypothetical protein